jgi:hypothetical protein
VDVKCFTCRQLGHRAADCPVLLGGGGFGDAGAAAGGVGLGMIGPGGRFGGGGLMGMGVGAASGVRGDEQCMRCGQKGHRSSQCPSRAGQVRRCWTMLVTSGHSGPQ